MPSAIPFEYLSNDRLRSLGLTQAEIVESLEAAIRDKAQNRLWTAPKTAVLPGDGRYMMATLAASDKPGIIAVKSVMVSPRNPARGLPGINGSILILDSETGALLAVADAGWITAVRTAGLSGVIARRLADPGSSTIAFVGTGVQARSHLDAFVEVFPLSHAKILGRSQSGKEAFADYVTKKGLTAEICDDPGLAMQGADIVVSSITLSYDVDPFLDASVLKPGCFAAITDLAIPWLPESMQAFSQIFVDDRLQEAAMEKPMVSPELISGDLDSAVLGETPARFDGTGRTAFVFRGLAIGDLAVAGLAWQRLQAS